MSIKPLAIIFGATRQKRAAATPPPSPGAFDFGAFVNSLEGHKTFDERLELGIFCDWLDWRELTIQEKVSCYQYQLERVVFEAAGGKIRKKHQ